MEDFIIMKKKTVFVIVIFAISILLFAIGFVFVAQDVVRSEMESYIFNHILDPYGNYIREKVIENNYNIEQLEKWEEAYFTAKKEKLMMSLFDIYSKPTVYINPILRNAFIYIYANNETFDKYNMARGYAIIIRLDTELYGGTRIRMSSYSLD